MKKTFRDFPTLEDYYAYKEQCLRDARLHRPRDKEVRTVFVKVPATPAATSNTDPLQGVMDRLQTARENLRARNPHPPAGFEDMARENEAWSETEQSLITELAALRNRLMSGQLNRGDRQRMDRLERLFRAQKPKFEQAG